MLLGDLWELEEWVWCGNFCGCLELVVTGYAVHGCEYLFLTLDMVRVILTIALVWRDMSYMQSLHMSLRTASLDVSQWQAHSPGDVTPNTLAY